MKSVRFIYFILMLILVCSCTREGSALSEYRSLAKELKVNSTDYTQEDGERAIKKYEKLEEKISRCNFSKQEKKELNRLRGQCAAYMLKAISKQTKRDVEDVMEQFADMAEGFNEALGEEGMEGLFNDTVE